MWRLVLVSQSVRDLPELFCLPECQRLDAGGRMASMDIG